MTTADMEGWRRPSQDYRRECEWLWQHRHSRRNFSRPVDLSVPIDDRCQNEEWALVAVAGDGTERVLHHVQTKEDGVRQARRLLKHLEGVRLIRVEYMRIVPNGALRKQMPESVEVRKR